jgi:asparagine synthase (glutamine-hydrolysing)
MAGIVGIQQGDRKTVEQMLSHLLHRGDSGSKVIERDGIALGAIWSEAQTAPTPRSMRQTAVWDAKQPPLPDPKNLEQSKTPFSMASMHVPGELFLARDSMGVSPLYYGFTENDQICFASEVKALLELTRDVSEFPPNTWYTTNMGFRKYPPPNRHTPFDANVERFAQELLLRLEQAVCERVSKDEMGAWLSGGLDSSAIVALARPHVNIMHTFAAGLAGAPDLIFAQEVADYFDTQHHAILLTLDNILDVLPEVIYHLESFDALLVRSSVTNYLVAEAASQHVDVSFSGEGADELFAGYEYMQQIPVEDLDDEMTLLTGKLHNTALQRVDRSAAAHGLVVHVPFLDPEVVAYAQGIPAELKLKRQNPTVEKYILRKALEGILPKSVLWRKKTKFWQGTGLGDLLSQYAEEKISQADFNQERALQNGWKLNTKEELLYYRIFKAHFGDLEQLDWVGRTKGAPEQK